MRKRILLVDDQSRNLLALAALLEPQGHELVQATDGRGALAVFARGGVDLVLLDVMMPGLDGIDVLRRLRASAEGAHVPVVLLTAHGDRERRLAGLEAGADDFIEKPIDVPVLLARVRTLLALKEAHDALQRRNEALREAQRHNRELGALLVRDLTSPLRVVAGALEAIRGGLQPSQFALVGPISDARAATARMQSLVHDLLVLARLESPGMPLAREALVVSRLVRAVLTAYEGMAEARGVTLQRPPEGAIAVRADGALLRRVLENLLDNAMRYAPRGGRVGVELAVREGLEVTVTNDGPRVHPDDRARIFEKFTRGRDEAGPEGGAGLGLYFCRQVMDAHGGAIDLVDRPGWSTALRLRFPREASEAAPP